MDLTPEGRKRNMPDILATIAALSSDAVPTPPELARAMLDLLPDEVWSNPDFKWLDPAVKSGSILREIATRLMKGLEEWEPDPHKRAGHILGTMLHGYSITKLHAEMGRRSVYRSKDAKSEKAYGRGDFFDDHEGNIRFVHAEHQFKRKRNGDVDGNCQICGAPADLERGFDRENYAYAFIHDTTLMERLRGMKFDVIVTNPPYQSSMETADGEKTANILPLYHRFIEDAIALEPKYVSMIVPSRWFAGGKGLDEFRATMIADRRLAKIVDNPKLYDCFPGVKIQGGVNYFLWDRDHEGDCEFSTRIDGLITSTAVRDLRDGDGVLMRDNRAASVVEKVKAVMSESLESVVSTQDPFGQHLKTNFQDFRSEPFDGSIPLVFGSHVGHIRRDQLARNEAWVDKYKVIVPKAFGDSSESLTVIGEPIALGPGSACTQTYLVAGVFAAEPEAANYANYLASKFARFMVSLRKGTQDVIPDRFRFVPLLDMTRSWTDEDLYAHFGLTQDETDYIEATIKPRSVNLSLDSAVPASHLPGGSKYRPPGKRASEDETSEDED